MLHYDAVQGYGKINFTAATLGADLISVSAHKLHGPKGTGALYVKKGTKMFSLHLGGGQEKGVRSGTESTPLIAGFGKAVEFNFSSMEKDVQQMKAVRDYCMGTLTDQIPSAVIHSNKQGAPHIVNFSLPGLSNNEVVDYLSSREISISSAAACKSNHSRGPSMLESLGFSRSLADSALRVSLSPHNTESDINELVGVLKEYLQKTL